MVTVVNGGGNGGGGAVILGIVVGAILVLVLLFVFGGQLFSGSQKKSIDVDVNLPKVETPAK